MLRPIGCLSGKLAGHWNRDFSKNRPDNARRYMRSNMRCMPKGKGNKAWKRVESLYRDPAYLVWPDYAIYKAITRGNTARNLMLALY